MVQKKSKYGKMASCKNDSKYRPVLDLSDNNFSQDLNSQKK